MKLLRILPCIFLLGCELEDPKIGVSTSEIISTSLDKPSIQADGNDRVLITATLGDEGGVNQEIKFTTDQGTFAGTTDAQELSVTSSGKTAEAFLISDLDINEKVTVTVKVGDFSTSEIVEFTRVLPDNLLLKADKLKLVANQSDKIMLTVSIFKDGKGNPSNETRIDFEQSFSGTNNLQELELQTFGFTTDGSIAIPVLSRNDSTGLVRVIAFAGNDRMIADTLTLDITN